MAKSATLIFCCLSGVLFPRYLPAAKWSVDPYVAVGGVRNDNVRLTTGPHESVSGTNVTLGINSSRETAASLVSVNALANGTRYSGDDEEDLDEQIVELRSRNQATERTSWRLDGTFKRDTLLRSIDIPGQDPEIDQLDLGDTDIGLVQQKVRRNRLRLRPSWTHEVTQRTSVRLRYALTDVSYSDEEGTGLVDNETHQVTVTVSRKLTERADLNFTGEVSRNRAPDADSRTDNVAILGGITHAFSPTMRGTLSAGVRETSFEVGAQSDRDSGFVYQASLQKRSELTRLTAVLRRDVDPSGIGRSAQTDELVIRLRQRISPRLVLLLRANVFRVEALVGDPTGVDRDYAELWPVLRWQRTRERSILASYRYRRRRFDAEPESATSNAVFIGVAIGRGGATQPGVPR